MGILDCCDLLVFLSYPETQFVVKGTDGNMTFNLFGFNSSPLGAKRSIKIQLIHNTSLSSETRKLSGSERACPGDTLFVSLFTDSVIS